MVDNIFDFFIAVIISLLFVLLIVMRTCHEHEENMERIRMECEQPK